MNNSKQLIYAVVLARQIWLLECIQIDAILNYRLFNKIDKYIVAFSLVIHRKFWYTIFVSSYQNLVILSTYQKFSIIKFWLG